MNKHICRAKDIHTGEWVYGYYVTKQDPLLGISYHYILRQEVEEGSGILNSLLSWYRVDPDTVCRYIGCEDEHGKPIFEGDILCGTVYHFFGKWTSAFVVHWDDDCGGWGLQNFESGECEIVGNKFDDGESYE